MKIKNLILAIIAVALFNIIVGMLTCGGVFSWVYKLEPTNVWKSMESISPLLMFGGMILVDAIFVSIYALIKNGVPGRNKIEKGLLYGLIIWIVGLVPGMISTYTYMTVATTVVIYWTIWGLIVSPIKGLIASSIYGE